MRTAYFKYIFALLLFGSNGVVASHIELNSYEIVLLRSVLGGAVLAAIYFLTGRKWTVLQHRKDGMYIALSGIAMALDWLLLFEAYQQIGVSLGMLINYCGPVIVVALSVVLFKERMTRFKAAALMMALLGVFLISGQAAAKGVNGWGLLCAGLSALAYSAMVIFNKLSKEITGMENAVLQLFFAAMTVVVFVGCKQGLHMKIAPGETVPKYPKISRSWRENWPNLCTYFKFPQEVRRLIYTTNTIEGFNRQLRKVTKSKSVFPTDDSLLKMLYLAMTDITKKWTGRRQDWNLIYAQLVIFFGDRIPE